MCLAIDGEDREVYMKRKDKLVIAALVAIIANLVILVGITNNAGISSDESDCFNAPNGVQVCR